MKVTSTGIANGYWEDRFGKFGTELSAEGTPCLLYTSDAADE